MSIVVVWLQDVFYPAFLSVARRFWPLPRFCRYVIVTRFDDVQEVMHRWQDFPVPYGAKARKLGWRPNFLLGMKGDLKGPYARQRNAVEKLWHPDDLPRVQRIAKRITDEALREHLRAEEKRVKDKRNFGKFRAYPFDAMQKIIVPSAVAIVEEYYGVKVDDRLAFVSDTYQVAAFLFGPPKPRKSATTKAQDAIRRIFGLIDKSLAIESAANDSIIARARRCHIRDKDLRSWLMGMTVGFIPAHTNAAGRALHVLLDDVVGRTEMKTAAIADMDDALLTLCYEALRFRYILPGLWRKARGTPTINEGTERPFQFRKGDILYVSPLSAMHDRNRILRPDTFMPNRPNNLYLIYGYAMHNCVGRGIADALLKENFRPLFAGGVARLRCTRWQGSIPAHISVVIGPRSDAY